MQEDINRQFSQLLGRGASADELAYLGKFIDEGHLQPFEISQLIQAMPEYQQKQLNADTSAYGDLLAKSDADVLGKAGAAINSQFARLGRPVSSGQVGALAQVGQNLAQQRQSALAQFYGNGLNTNRSLAQGYGQNALSRGYGLRDEARHRGWEIEDYYRQQNDFNNYQNAHSGWNAITPQFVAGGLFQAGGQALGAYAGGMAARR